MLGARTFSLICFLDTKAFQIGIKLNLLASQATSSSCYHILCQLARRHPWRQPQWEALEPVTHHHGITREEIKKWPKHIHEVLGGDITADPLPLSDDDYLSIYEASYK